MLVGHYTKEEVDNTNLITTLVLTLYPVYERGSWERSGLRRYTVDGAVILSTLFLSFFLCGGIPKGQEKKLLPKTNLYTPGHLGTGVHNFPSTRFASGRLTAELKIPPHYTGLGALERFVTNLVLSFWLTLIFDMLHNFTDINHYDAQWTQRSLKLKGRLCRGINHLFSSVNAEWTDTNQQLNWLSEQSCVSLTLNCTVLVLTGCNNFVAFDFTTCKQIPSRLVMGNSLDKKSAKGGQSHTHKRKTVTIRSPGSLYPKLFSIVFSILHGAGSV